MSLLQQHLAHIDRVRGRRRILTYVPPCCGTPTETPVPDDPDDAWDTLTVCPHCGALGIKIATRGSVTIELLESGECMPPIPADYEREG